MLDVPCLFGARAMNPKPQALQHPEPHGLGFRVKTLNPKP